MYLNKYIYATCLAATLSMLGCTTENKNADNTAAEDTAATTDTAAAAATPSTAANSPLSALPPTSEVPAMLQLSGAEFNPTLVNASGKASSYTTTNEKAALNLGVYATDIGYLSTYDKTQDVINYLKAGEKLANHLGLSNAFGANMQDRFQKNVSNKDSLVRIVDETMAYVNSHLKEGERDATAAMVVTGSFIEGLHVSTGLIEKYPKDVPAETRNLTLTKLIRTIIEQEKSLDDLIKILEEVKSDAQVQTYLTQLQDLKRQYDALNLDDKIKNNQGDLAVSDQTLKGITTKVKEIRSKIVS